MEPKLIKEKLLCRGKRVELLQQIYEYAEGLIAKDVVRFGQSVAVIPFKDPGRVILIRQYRAAVGKWIYEIPAGRVEQGEELERAALRELREETGYVAKNLEKLVSIYPSPGYSDEVIHIYIARDLTYIGSEPEKGELIKTLEADLDSALNIVLSSDTIDAKTLIALLMAKQLLKSQTEPR